MAFVKQDTIDGFRSMMLDAYKTHGEAVKLWDWSTPSHDIGLNLGSKECDSMLASVISQYEASLASHRVPVYTNAETVNGETVRLSFAVRVFG